MICHNCTPIPRPRCHTVKAVIDKGIVYCIDCGADVSKELDVEKICGDVSEPAIGADVEKCGNCGAELQAYCSNCFRSSTSNCTAFTNY